MPATAVKELTQTEIQRRILEFLLSQPQDTAVPADVLRAVQPADADAVQQAMQTLFDHGAIVVTTNWQLRAHREQVPA